MLPPATVTPPGVCWNVAGARCRGVSGERCTELALSAWSHALDESAVACVAGMFAEGCSLGDARACGFAGRLWLDRGTRDGSTSPSGPDAGKALEMLLSACDGGFDLACWVGDHWLSNPMHGRELPSAPDLRTRFEAEGACLLGNAEECYRVGVDYYFGRGSLARDRVRAVRAYGRGCDLGDPGACNNLADALAYGEGTERDVTRAAALFDKACRLGYALGCANLGFMAEHGEGIAPDTARARALYRDACVSGDVYGCLHAEMLAAQDAGAPRDPMQALAHFERACERSANAKACAFVGLLYEDGPDGKARDEAKSSQAMSRACKLGERRACEWMKFHLED